MHGPYLPRAYLQYDVHVVIVLEEAMEGDDVRMAKVPVQVYLADDLRGTDNNRCS